MKNKNAVLRKQIDFIAFDGKSVSHIDEHHSMKTKNENDYLQQRITRLELKLKDSRTSNEKTRDEYDRQILGLDNRLCQQSQELRQLL